MSTLKKKMARLRRRIWQSAANRPAKASKPATAPLMPIEEAEALALEQLAAGLKQLAKHPRRVRANSLSRIAAHLLTHWRLDDALHVNNLAIACVSRPKLHTQRANILHAMGRTPQMIESARTAHEMDPFEHRAIRILATFAPDAIMSTKAMERLIYSANDPAKAAARASRAMFRADRPAETLRAMKRVLERVDLSPEQRDQIEYYAGVAAEFSSSRSALRYFTMTGPLGSAYENAKKVGKARCLLKLGKPDAALEAGSPEVQFCAVRMAANLQLDRIGTAYAEYLNRQQTHGLGIAFPNYRAPGSNQLLLAEGGPGDEIRFASLLKDSGAKLATCEPRLASLLRRSFPDIEFIPVERPRYEFRSSSYADRSDVGHIQVATFADNTVMARAREMDGVTGVLDILSSLRPDRSAFPGRPYLTPDPARIDYWRRFLPNDRPNVALNWRSMLFSIHRSQHYLMADQWEALKSLNARFWLFQPGIQMEEVLTLHEMIGAEVAPFLDAKDDFEGQAAFLSCMDAVIAPFSTTAELAGALGVPTFMMAMTPNTQWRRNDDGSDIWHRSGRVICGTSATMADQIAEALAAILKSWTAPEPNKAPYNFTAIAPSEPEPASPRPIFSHRQQRDYAEALIFMESAYMPE